MTKFALPHLQKKPRNIICAGSEAGFERLAGIHSLWRQQRFFARLC